MAWLWLISVGATDVQFPVWKENELGQWIPYRFRRDKGGVRAVHEGLLVLLQKDRIAFPGGRLPADIRSEEASNLILQFERDGEEFLASIAARNGTGAIYRISGQGNEIPNERESSLPLYCPKVADLLDVGRATFGGEPVTVVVLNTRRVETLPDGPDEPIASGPLVAKFLADQLGLVWRDNAGMVPLVVEPGTSTWLDILTGSEVMEDAGAQQEVVRRLTALIRAWSPEGNRQLAITTAGGLPPLKPIIERVPATCLGQRSILLLDKPERQAPATVLALNYDERVVERETLRFYCVEALRHGDYVGAYGLASRYEADWARRVRDILGPFLNLPGNRTALMYNGRLLHRFEVYAGQIEVHLQAGDPSGAVLALNSFLEAATWHLLCSNTVIRDADLTPSPETESINGIWPINQATVVNITGLLEQDHDARRNQHKISKLLRVGLAWLQNNANAGGYYQAAVNALILLRDIYDDGDPSLRQCRNSIAHGAGKVITPAIIGEQIVKVGFKVDQPFGENFLNKKPVSGLLANLESEMLKDFIKKQFENLLDLVIRG